MADFALIVDGVSKIYGSVIAINNLYLQVEHGTYCCLLGPSRCGLSTLLRLIAGHEAVSGGRIFICQHEVTSLPAAKRHTALLPQTNALVPQLTLIDNVALGLKGRLVERPTRQALALSMLEKVGLAAYRDRLVGQLSRAQRQLVTLARELITEPSVVLLDDPLANLERKVRLELRGEFRLIQQELGITFVHATHSQEEALALADRVAIMEKGQVLRTSTHFPAF